MERWTKVYHKWTKHEFSKILGKIDHFSIYKIDSGQFKCLNFSCKTLQLHVYVKEHSCQLLLSTTIYSITWTKQQFNWKKKTSAHKFKLLYLVKEIKERKATRLSFHMLNLCPFFCGTAGPRKLSSAETYVGYTSALLYLNPQICHETMRELISILTIDRHITCFYFIQCILKENYRIYRVLFSEMLNSTPVDHKS